MLKFINLKKLTAKTLIAILMVGGLVAESSNKKAFAASCPGGNNGHGNNAPYTHYLNSGKLTIGHYDPSNPGQNKARLILDLVAGIQSPNLNNNRPYNIKYVGYDGSTSYNLTNIQAIDIVNSHPDWEIKGNENTSTELQSGCGDQDNDGIDDAVEVGSNFNSPLDSDGDGTPNYIDTDSDNDGVADSVEGTGDDDNDGIANYIDNSDNSSSDRTTSIAPETITLVGSLRDFEDTHPDFERSPGQGGFKYGLDRGITTNDLGSDLNPVYAGGSFSTTTKENFDQWYRDVSGVNRSIQHPITFERQDNGVYRYSNSSFFPIDNQLFGNDSRPHNYHFTYELHTRFTYKGGETFKFSGDDDVWVYINGKKVIDIGGVHSKLDASVNLDAVASEIGLEVGEIYELDFFFAERHTTQSNFTIETNLLLEKNQDADTDTDNDGIPDYRDSEDDNDSEDDRDETDEEEENEEEEEPTPTPENDADNNGILDKDERPNDLDGDGIANKYDLDDDGDNIADVMEIHSPSDIADTGTRAMTHTLRDGTEITVILPNPPETNIKPNEAINSDGRDKPDYMDTDSDNDYISDKHEAGDTNLETVPFDADSDGTPNYLDGDSDNDYISDKIESGKNASDGDDVEPVNTDGGDEFTNKDDIPDYLDYDSDNDYISDKIESGITVSNTLNIDDTINSLRYRDLRNTDGDDVPDYLDRDSDADNISDRDESGKTAADDLDDAPVNTDANRSGGDNIPDYLDRDSDADGYYDIYEAGDEDLATPPRNSDSSISGDSIADFRDLDSDDNGILDSEEEDSNIDPQEDNLYNFQDLDDDGDGIIDIIEIGGGDTPLNSDNAGDADYQVKDSDDDLIPDNEEGVKTDTTGTTPVSVTYPNGSKKYLLQDYNRRDTENDGERCINEDGTTNYCSITVTSTTNGDGTVNIEGTITGLDYQTRNFSD